MDNADYSRVGDDLYDAYNTGYEEGLRAGRAERKHGQWMKRYGTDIAEPVPLSKSGCVHGEVRCSVCGAYLCGSVWYDVSGNFCPTCGADMR